MHIIRSCARCHNQASPSKNGLQLDMASLGRAGLVHPRQGVISQTDGKAGPSEIVPVEHGNGDPGAGITQSALATHAH
jgi:hypothetical protein